MEGFFGIGYLAKEILIASMIKAYEKEIQETARIASLVREATRSRPAWCLPTVAADW